MFESWGLVALVRAKRGQAPKMRSTLWAETAKRGQGNFGSLLRQQRPLDRVVAWMVTPIVLVFMWLFGTRLLKMASKPLVIIIAAVGISINGQIASSSSIFGRCWCPPKLAGPGSHQLMKFFLNFLLPAFNSNIYMPFSR